MFLFAEHATRNGLVFVLESYTHLAGLVFAWVGPLPQNSLSLRSTESVSCGQTLYSLIRKFTVLNDAITATVRTRRDLILTLLAEVALF